MSHQPHFDVDRKGLAQLLERRGEDWPRFVVFELVQNALDEKTSRVEVRVFPVPGIARVGIEVTDDSPDGFRDLSHAWTLFAPSAKKGDVALRGRFNLGEKLVAAVAHEMTVISTKGGVRFDAGGRHPLRERRATGTRVQVLLNVPHATCDILRQAVRDVIVPEGIDLVLDGEALPHRERTCSFEETLATVVADGEGVLRPARRVATVHVYDPGEGAGAWLYELGIPVVPLDGDRYSYDVQQKVPLGLERDGVPPAYLRALRVHAANAMPDRIDAEQANRAWVRDALSDERASGQMVAAAVAARFGEKVVVADPNDTESAKTATSRGYTVVHGSQLSAAEWENVRKAGVVPSSHALFPTPGSEVDPSRTMRLVPREEWTPGMRVVARYTRLLAEALPHFRGGVLVLVAREPHERWSAKFYKAEGGQPAHVYWNAGTLGAEFFDRIGRERALPDEVVDLALHELAHQDGGHLDHAYHEFLSQAGACMRRLGHLDEEALAELGRKE
jgi:hypothetical protein